MTPDDTPPPHKRRPRYSGKNPRRFHEKYKELHPEKFAADVRKILDSGKTPAGMHRVPLSGTDWDTRYGSDRASSPFAHGGY